MTKTIVKFSGFVAVCLAFTLWLGFTIGNIDLLDPLARDNFELTATFDDVTGLLINDNVKIAGVVVGKVTDIKVASGRALVTFSVDNDYQDRLPVDTSAAVRWRNLIGQRYLYLYPGTASTTLEAGGEITQTTSVIDLGALFNRLGPIVAAIDESQVNDFLETIVQALDGNEDRIGQAIDDLATLTSGLASRDEAITRLVENLNTVAGTITTRDQQIRTMLDNLVLIAQSFSDNTATVDAALTEFSSFSSDLSSLIRANRTQIDAIIANVDLIVNEEVRPRIEQIGQTLDGLDEMARGLFDAGRLGEMLTQTILCATVTPPTPGTPCPHPVIIGVPSEVMAANSAGRDAPSFDAGVATIVTLVSGGAT